MELEAGLPPTETQGCPRCTMAGKEIPRKTAFQHLNSQGLSRILLWKKIYVCLEPRCECLYYSAWQWVPQSDSNKPLGFKKGEGPRTWCYCFGYSDEEVRQSLDDRGVSQLLKQIEDYTLKGGHLCELTHPAGECCLNFVRNLTRGRRPPEPTGEPR